MRSRRLSNQPLESSTGIDLAPMLDFVLNLLIFFIITAVFTRALGIEVSRPGMGVAAAGKPAKAMIVTVRADGDVVIDGRVLDFREVRPNVERMHATRPGNGVIVVADEGVAAGLVVKVIDQVRQGGVENISFGAKG
jgi:biopolymer transport protein ExbD